jgi:anti-sigma factor RsiW
MSACREWNDRLLDFALGALEGSEARAVEAHVRGCAACARALTELRTRSEGIDAAVHHLVAGVQLSPEFRACVLAQVEAHPARVSWRPGRAGMFAALVVSVLIAVAVLRLSPGKWRRTPKHPEPRPVTKLSTWRSPTDALLRSSADELLDSSPQFGQFYFRLEPARKDRGERKGRPKG